MALRQERVAQRLAELRERHDLSQEKAAQKVGITHRQWQRWENGESLPRAGKLGEVALVFGVPLESFYDEDQQPERERLDEAITLLKQLGERQEALIQSVAGVAEMVEELATARRPAAQRQRRSA